MAENLTYISLTPGNAPEVGSAPITYEQIVASVGMPTSVFLLEYGITLYYCGEGSKNNWPINESADTVANGYLRGDSHVYGNAIVLGTIQQGGRPGGLTDEQRDEVLAVLGG